MPAGALLDERLYRLQVRYAVMTQEMKGLLLEDRWAPVTSTMGFLELEAEQAAQAFATWHRGLVTTHGFTIEVLPVSGTLEQVLSLLLPLSGGETQRRLFIPTRSAWTAYVSNQWTGTDAASPMSVMARRLSIRGLRVVAVPHTLRGDRGRYGAVMLEVYGAPWPLPMMGAAGSSTRKVSPSPSSKWSSTTHAG